jgi:mycothiol system anti-sigma-R factor
MRIPCDHVAEELWNYLDDEIDDPVIRRIDAHLEICARCFPEYDYRRSFLALLDRHAEDPIPPRLRRWVFESLLAIDAGAN